MHGKYGTPSHGEKSYETRKRFVVLTACKLNPTNSLATASAFLHVYKYQIMEWRKCINCMQYMQSIPIH